MSVERPGASLSSVTPLHDVAAGPLSCSPTASHCFSCSYLVFPKMKRSKVPRLRGGSSRRSVGLGGRTQGLRASGGPFKEVTEKVTQQAFPLPFRAALVCASEFLNDDFWNDLIMKYSIHLHRCSWAFPSRRTGVAIMPSHVPSKCALKRKGRGCDREQHLSGNFASRESRSAIEACAVDGPANLHSVLVPNIV